MTSLDELTKRAHDCDVLKVAQSLGADLKRNGTEWHGPCPKCAGTDRFSVRPSENVWHCRGCDRGGDPISLVENVLGLSFKEAVEHLAGEEAEFGRGGGDRGRSSQRPARDSNRAHGPAERGERRSQEQAEQREAPPKGKREIAKSYDYTDPDGNLVYQVVRHQWKLPDGSWERDSKGAVRKTFGQRRPSGLPDKSWIWGLGAGEFMRRAGQDWYPFNGERFRDGMERRVFNDAVEHGLYRWPQLEIGISEGRIIVIPEGEKDVETLEAMDVVATTNSGGAKNWRPDHAEVFRGADVVIPVDNDRPGRERGDVIARSLKGVAGRVRILDLALHWPHMPAKADITDWVEQAGGTKEKLRDILKDLEDWRPAPPASRFNGIPIDRISLGSAKKHSWIINDLLPARDVSMIYGPSQSGKSFLAEEMALCIGRGIDFFGHKVKQGGIIYVAGEGGLGFQKRLYGYKQHHGINGRDEIPFTLLPVAVNIFRKDGDTKALIEEIETWQEYWKVGFGVDLQAVFIDTLAASSAGADENSFKDMSYVLDSCRAIVEHCQCAVPLVHHANAGGQKARGHSSVFANLETVIQVSVDPETKVRTARIEKQKDAEAGGAFRFELMSVEVGVREDDGKPITTCIVLPVGQKAEIKGKGGFRLRNNDPAIFGALWARLKRSGRLAPAGVPAPPGKEVIEYTEWREEYAPTAIVDIKPGDDEDKKRESEISRRMKASSKFMKSMGIIGYHHPYVWWTGKPVAGFPDTFPKEEKKPEASGLPDDDLPF